MICLLPVKQNAADGVVPSVFFSHMEQYFIKYCLCLIVFFIMCNTDFMYLLKNLWKLI